MNAELPWKSSFKEFLKLIVTTYDQDKTLERLTDVLVGQTVYWTGCFISFELDYYGAYRICIQMPLANFKLENGDSVICKFLRMNANSSFAEEWQQLGNGSKVDFQATFRLNSNPSYAVPPPILEISRLGSAPYLVLNELTAAVPNHNANIVEDESVLPEVPFGFNTLHELKSNRGMPNQVKDLKVAWERIDRNEYVEFRGAIESGDIFDCVGNCWRKFLEIADSYLVSRRIVVNFSTDFDSELKIEVVEDITRNGPLILTAKIRALTEEFFRLLRNPKTYREEGFTTRQLADQVFSPLLNDRVCIDLLKTLNRDSPLEFYFCLDSDSSEGVLIEF